MRKTAVVRRRRGERAQSTQMPSPEESTLLRIEVRGRAGCGRARQAQRLRLSGSEPPTMPRTVSRPPRARPLAALAEVLRSALATSPTPRPSRSPADPSSNGGAGAYSILSCTVCASASPESSAATTSSAFLKFESYLSPHRARAPRLRGSALRAARDGLRAARPKGCGDRCSVAPDCLFSRINSLFTRKNFLFPIAVSLIPLAAMRAVRPDDDAVALACGSGGAHRRNCALAGTAEGVGKIFCGVFLRIIKYSGTNREQNAGSPEFRAEEI